MVSDRRPSYILSFDPGAYVGWTWQQGGSYIASGEVVMDTASGQGIYYLCEDVWDALSDHGVGDTVDVLCIEKLHLGKWRSQTILTASEVRGMLRGMIACHVFLEPPKTAWNMGKLTDAGIRERASEIAGRQVKSQHEAEAILMGQWAWQRMCKGRD